MLKFNVAAGMASWIAILGSYGYVAEGISQLDGGVAGIAVILVAAAVAALAPWLIISAFVGVFFFGALVEELFHSVSKK